MGTTLPYPSPAVLSTLYDPSTGNYPDRMDQFNRPKRSVWERSGVGAFYDLSITHDASSNPTSTVDNVRARAGSGDHIFDVVYTMDSLDRLTRADEGERTGTTTFSIASGTRTRNEEWDVLSQTGNWEIHQLDADGDGSFAGSIDRDEPDAYSLYSNANELKERRSTKAGSDYDHYDYTYDLNGNLIGEDLALVRAGPPATTINVERGFVYDPFGRLVRLTGALGTTVCNYRYNGLGYRIMSQSDENLDEVIDDADRRLMMYDPMWRIVAIFHDGEDAPRESFVYHVAGLSGSGNSSYVDSVILRDRDTNADESLEERRFYCQNWRADVVAVLAGDGVPLEYVRYSPYGEPTVYPVADVNFDGIVDSTDTTDWTDLTSGGTGDAAYTNDDLNFDGLFPDMADSSWFFDSEADNTGLSGRGRVSSPAVGSMFGYAGYVWDNLVGGYHVRHRTYLPEIGKWAKRDPLGYVHGSLSLYNYVNEQPIRYVDPLGLEPNKEGAKKNCANLIVVIKRLENQGMTKDQILKHLEDQHGTNFERYFYTDKYGWVDVRHFMAASRTANDVGSVATELLGFGVELKQWCQEGEHDYQSGFASEDLSSNEAGAEFGDDYINGDEKLSDSLIRWCNDAGARDYLDSHTGYWTLPDKDPAVRGPKPPDTSSSNDSTSSSAQTCAHVTSNAPAGCSAASDSAGKPGMK